MKTFFETVGKTVWGPKFYVVTDSRTVRESLNYFLSLLFLTSFISVAVIAIFAVPAGLSFLNQIAGFAAEKYPPDLKIIFANGTASSTPEAVYAVAFPSEFLNNGGRTALPSQNIKNMLVVDTSAVFTGKKQIEDDKTVFLLTKDSLVTEKNNGGFEVRPIPADLNLTVTKPFVEEWSSKIVTIAKFASPFIVAFGFLLLFITNAVKYFVFAAIAGFIMWGIAFVGNRKGNYRQFLNAALYAVTLPILLNLVLFILGAGVELAFGYVIAIAIVIWALNVRIWEKTSPRWEKNEPPV